MYSEVQTKRFSRYLFDIFAKTNLGLEIVNTHENLWQNLFFAWVVIVILRKLQMINENFTLYKKFQLRWHQRRQVLILFCFFCKLHQKLYFLSNAFE